MYHNEKVLKACDQRDIVWFVSSASECYLRRHWPECFGRVKKTFCLVSPPSKLKMFTGSVCVLAHCCIIKINRNKNKIIVTQPRVRAKKTRWRVKGK